MTGPTPPPPKPGPKASASAIEQYAQEVRQQRLGNVAAQRTLALARALEAHQNAARPVWMLVDGGYTNRTFLSAIPQKITVVGRIRRDAKLHYLPENQKPKGRKKAYGPQAPTPEALRQDAGVPWQKAQVLISGKLREVDYKSLGPLRWRPTGQHKTVQVLALRPIPYRLSKNARLNRRPPVYLICTDPRADPATVIQHYVWRWGIEVNFRDEKTLLGVGEAQVRNPASVQNTTALGVAAYAVLLCAALLCERRNADHKQIAPPKWQRTETPKPTTMKLLQSLRVDMLAQSIHFSDFVLQQETGTKPQKSMPHMLSALEYASRYT